MGVCGASGSADNAVESLSSKIGGNKGGPEEIERRGGGGPPDIDKRGGGAEIEGRKFGVGGAMLPCFGAGGAIGAKPPDAGVLGGGGTNGGRFEEDMVIYGDVVGGGKGFFGILVC
jgi:hypothetical protein